VRNPDDSDRFRLVMLRLGKIFPRKTVDTETIDYYFQSLKDLPIDTVEQCADAWQRNGQKFPLPGNLRPVDDKPIAVRGNVLTAIDQENTKHWDQMLAKDPVFTKLLLADALLGRYDVEADQASLDLAERRLWLRDRVAGLVRAAKPAEVLGDYRTLGLVRALFGEPGVNRLRNLAAA